MNIAIGSDHHGAEFAKLLTRNLFLPNHYGGLDPIEKLQPGAALIENACVGSEPQTGPSRIMEIRYSLDKAPHPQVAKGQCVDYPDIAAAVAEAVSQGRADRGVLICGTGIGMCVTANKFKGVRATLCYNEITAELSRRHNNANVLCFSGDLLTQATMEALVRTWFATPFDGERHLRRIQLIDEIEEKTGL